MTRFSPALSVLGLLFVLPATQPASASVPDNALTASQRDFIAARKALSEGKIDTFEQLKSGLREYTLYDFLEYEALHRQFRNEKPGKSHVQALNAFEKSSKDEALTRKLTHTLQRSLVDAKKWHLFLGVSKSRVASDMPCATLRARYETGKINQFDDEALALWVEPAKRPDLCSSALEKLEKRKAPPISAIWERIYAAMEKDRPKYAEELLHYLGSADRRRVKNWIGSLEKPGDYLRTTALDEDSQLNRRVFVDLVLAWSKNDPVSAMNHWLANYAKYRFFKDRYYDTHRLLAMRGAYRRLPEAYEWLNSLEAREDDLELMEWRVRAALYEQDWDAVLRSIRQLPEEEQEEDHWAYWVGKVLEKSGKTEEALAIYRELSELQSYHGFLAADRLSLPYSIKDQPIEADASILDELRSDPRLLRSREYYRVEVAWEGRREWNSVQKDATPEKLAAMAVLAQSWRMHDRAIFSAGLAEQKRALTTRFPVVYQDEVDAAASEHRIDPAWVFGVMRRESAYIRDVRSSAGAIGLMQLMPNTAKYVAKLQGQKNWKGDLTDARTNIGFGSFYLRHVMDKFDDHVVLATASYNAGPRRVGIWLPPNDMQADVWIDAIPYSETRRYVRAVLAYTAIYEWHLTREPQRLSDKMRIVPAADSGV